MESATSTASEVGVRGVPDMEGAKSSLDVVSEFVSENWMAGGRFRRHSSTCLCSSVLTAGRGRVPDSAIYTLVY